MVNSKTNEYDELHEYNLFIKEYSHLFSNKLDIYKLNETKEPIEIIKNKYSSSPIINDLVNSLEKKIDLEIERIEVC